MTRQTEHVEDRSDHLRGRSEQAAGDHGGASHHAEVGFRLAGRDRSDRFQQRPLSERRLDRHDGAAGDLSHRHHVEVIRSIIANFSENPGIKEGDMFILNDPYRGAIHQPDVSIVAPVFLSRAACRVGRLVRAPA